jgi:hypothetical protein
MGLKLLVGSGDSGDSCMQTHHLTAFSTGKAQQIKYSGGFTGLRRDLCQERKMKITGSQNLKM